MRINKEQAGLFPTESLDLTRLFHRVDDRAKPPLWDASTKKLWNRQAFCLWGLDAIKGYVCLID